MPTSDASLGTRMPLHPGIVGRGGDAVGNPYRAQISQFELFEFILV